MLAHPIVLEFIKAYDIVVNFKNLVTKSLPNNTDSEETLLTSLYEKLSKLDSLSFDNDSLVTPQIVNMTTSIDQTLHEIQFVFTTLVDEYISSKYDSLEKEQQLIHLRQQLRPSRSGSMIQMKKQADHEQEQRIQLKVLEQQQNGIKESEMLIKEKEQALSHKEKEITNLEIKLRQKEKFLNEKLRQIEYEETKFMKEKSDFELKQTDAGSTKSNTPFTPAPSINTGFFYPVLSNVEEKPNIKSESLNTINSSRLNNTVATSEEVNHKLTHMKEIYEESERKHSKEIQFYQRQVVQLKQEVQSLKEIINQLRKELEHQFDNAGRRLSAASNKSASRYMDLVNQIDNLHKKEDKQSINLPYINQTNQTTKMEFETFYQQEEQQQQSLPRPSHQRQTEKLEALYSSEPSIMFTRLDAERNVKRLRRAITRGFLKDQVYEVCIYLEYFFW